MRNVLMDEKPGFKKRLLVSAILLTLPTVATAAPSQPSYNRTSPANVQPSQQAALDKYALEEYNYCDSKVLAVFWGERSPRAAEIRLGEKMLRWGPQDGALIMQDARNQALESSRELPCTFEDGGYTYEDAEVLATFWGTKDLSEAKMKMDVMMVQGIADLIQSDLNDANQAIAKKNTNRRVGKVRPSKNPAKNQGKNQGKNRAKKPPRNKTGNNQVLTKKLSINADRTGVTAVAFTPDSRNIVSGGWENKIKIWNASNGRLKSTIDLSGKGDLILDLAISPNGKLVATSNRDYDRRADTVMVYDLKTRRPAYSLNRRPPDICADVEFSSNGKQLAAGCFDGSNGDRTLQVWDAKTGRADFTIQGANSPIVFTSNGEGLAATFNGENGLTAWSTSTAEEIGIFPNFSFNSAVFSSDDRVLIGGGFNGELRGWDTVSDKLLVTYKGHTDTINDVLYSPNNKMVASVSKDKTLRLWHATNGRQLAVFRAQGEIESLAFSPNGKQVVIGSNTGKITLLSINTNRSNNNNKNSNSKNNNRNKNKNKNKNQNQNKNRVTTAPPPRVQTRPPKQTQRPAPSVPAQTYPQSRPEPVDPALANYSHRVVFYGELDGESTYVQHDGEVVLITDYNGDIGVVGYMRASGEADFQWEIDTLDGDVWYVDWDNNLWVLDEYDTLEAIGIIEELLH